MLLFGRHKGYGLSVLIELVAGGLTGTGSSILPGFLPDYATVVMVVNIAAFQPLEQFCQMVHKFIEAIKAGRKAPGRVTL
jgi:LDH2 family malate/lactate/ureidoglycolate dehydrogenase